MRMRSSRSMISMSFVFTLVSLLDDCEFSLDARELHGCVAKNFRRPLKRADARRDARGHGVSIFAHDECAEAHDVEQVREADSDFLADERLHVILRRLIALV